MARAELVDSEAAGRGDMLEVGPVLAAVAYRQTPVTALGAAASPASSSLASAGSSSSREVASGS